MKELEKLRLIELIKDIKTFNDIYQITDTLTNKEKGDLFELITYYVFLLVPILNNDISNIWLYDNIPISIKKSLSLPNKDKGIDLLIKKKMVILMQFNANSDKIIIILLVGKNCLHFLV